MSDGAHVTSKTALVGRIDPGTSSLLGPVLTAFVRKEPGLLALLPKSSSEPARLLAEARARLGRALDPSLAQALESHHRRLGAGPRSMHALAELAHGRAVCVVSGQQPGPLGGPLFTWHKTWTAVALALHLTKAGVPAVPVFWNAAEDDDFEEIAHARWTGRDLTPAHGQMAREAGRTKRLVGSLPAGLASPLWHQARGDWASLPGSARAFALLEPAARAAETGGDLGDVMSSLLLAAFADEGLVVLDPRLPEFREACRPVYERYAELHKDVREKVDRAGDELEIQNLPRGFSPVQTEFALFEASGDGRRHLKPSEIGTALTHRVDLVPGAMLRPIVQDFVLPAAALAAGPGEIGYLAQLAGAYEVLGVQQSAVVPRWSATWLPHSAVAICEEAHIAAEDLIQAPDTALAAFLAAGVPRELTEDLLALRRHVKTALDRLGENARTLDRSLPELVAATRARIDWRLNRLGEGFAKKARRSWKRAHPEAEHLAEFLRPQNKLQERSLAWLDIIARGGRSAEETARERARAHVEEMQGGGAIHHDVLALEEPHG